MSKNLSDIFEAHGALSKALSSYAPRPQQIQAAEDIDSAMRNHPKVALVEAGTGVGKTMAYLIPALMHARNDRKVIISTHTLALQSQLWERDIPLAQSLQKRPVKAALVKGRGNYLCLQEMAAARGELWTAGDPLFQKITDWAQETETGDMVELPFTYPGWTDIRVNTDTCKGQECRWYEDCFYYRARRLAQDSALILVNHALFFADLAVRQTEPDARLLPDYDFVVLDEAHHLESAAAGAFGISITSNRLPALLAKVRRSARSLDIDETRLRTLESESEALFLPFTRSARPEFFIEELLGESMDGAREQAALIASLLDGLTTEIKHADASHNPILKDRMEGLVRQCIRVKEELTVLFNGVDENYLRWGSVTLMRGRPPMATLNWTPISVAPILRDTLWRQPIDAGAALVSATLSTNGRFEFIRQRLGLDGTSPPGLRKPSSPVP